MRIVALAIAVSIGASCETIAAASIQTRKRRLPRKGGNRRENGFDNSA